MEGKEEVQVTTPITGFDNYQMAFMYAALRDLDLAMRDILDKMTKMDMIKTGLLTASIKMLEKHLHELPPEARGAFDDVKNQTLPFFEKEVKMEDVCVHYDLIKSLMDKLKPFYDMIGEAQPEIIEFVEKAPFKEYEDDRVKAIDKLKVLQGFLPNPPTGMNLGDILGGGFPG